MKYATMEITIYHNPKCSKSRQTLELIQSRGYEPRIILYLKDTPSENELGSILDLLGKQAIDLLRQNEADYKAHFINRDNMSNQELIALMVQYPKVIERPIVVRGADAIIGRPPENVLTLLD